MIVIPEFLKHLDIYGEYPVPFIVQYIDGKPDFRVVDMRKWDECAAKNLCSICGRTLGEYSYIVGGPVTGRTYYFFDPPMHRPCALYSAEVCPYVSGKKRELSDRVVTVPYSSLDHIQPRNVDEELYIYKIRTSKTKVENVGGSFLFRAQRMLGRTLVRSSGNGKDES